jgi:glutathione peroxidase-family protein
VDKNGKVIARFGSNQDPQSKEVIDQIKKAMSTV